MKKLWIGIFFVIFILIFSLIATIGILYFTNKPQLSGELAFKGLQGKVTINRDENGIPHIAAEKSEQDAYFALGYVHAQDRFWQMEFNRRLAQGTLSEIFGSKTAPIDKYFRTWGLYRSAQKSYSYFSLKTKTILQSYTDGVNAYISQHKFPLQFQLLGIHPKPWTVIDSLSWEKILAWDLQTIWKEKFNNYLVAKNLGVKQIPIIFPPYPKDAPTILSDLDLQQSGIYAEKPFHPTEFNFANNEDKGSNNWVVSGKLTQSGKPLLANDPHLEVQSPSIWYLASIQAPNLNVVGATMPGIPGVVIGHNQNIAWGVTNVNPDTQDLYIIPTNVQNQIKIYPEIIKVGSHKTIVFNRREFNHLPILSDVTDTHAIGPAVAIKWTAFDPEDRTAQSILEIDTAHNWNEFTQALKDFDAPSQNFVYADIQGNIGYYLSGKIPIRHWNSDLPVIYDNQHQWSGYIPFAQLPHVYNPREGFLASANNLTVSNHYPYQINFRWSVPPYRIERIMERLKQEAPLDIQKMAAIQYDTYSKLWEDLSSYLLQTKPLDESSETALKYLKNWNGKADLDGIGMTIFAYWYRELNNLTPDFIRKQSKYPEPLFIKYQLQHPTSKLNQFLSQSLKTALIKLISDYGDQPHNWKWENIHHAVFKELGVGAIPIINILWNRSIPTPGGLYTVNVGTYDPENLIQNDSASYRQIIDLSNLDKSVYVLTLGESNDPFSPYYENQLPLWRNGKYLNMKNNQYKNVLVLMPKDL